MNETELLITPPIAADGLQILSLSARIDLFSPEEIRCVEELWNEYCAKGAEASGYHFVIARVNGQVAGFACYGPRPLTKGTFDLYWIAVDPAFRRRGIGKRLLQQVERQVRDLGGRLLIAETSYQEKYAPTRAFYLASGFLMEALIRDFYSAGDDLAIFIRRFQ